MVLPADNPIKKITVPQLVALAVALIITVVIILNRDALHRLEPLGYGGVFLVALIGNATIILPAPVLLFVYAAGASMPSPLLVGLLAGIGATFGEVTGYLAGYGTTSFVEQNQLYSKIQQWVERFGAWAVGLLAFVPNPFFDIAGVAAGNLKMPFRWFLLATFVGKVLKTTLVAYGGSLSIGWIERLFL
jgi:membrane protein YqaA with SNARE-associated domain